MSPKVSIIMNCKNGDTYLEESLKSVLNQTYSNWELIFVDNASVDKSREIFERLRDLRFKYIYLSEQVNLGSARQIALENCSGEYIAFLDTDDLWFEKKLEKQIKYFQNEAIGIVISNTVFFSKTKEKVFYSKSPPTGKVFFELLKNYFISLETLICKKEYIQKIQFKFDKKFSMISDMDLCLRLSQISQLDYCPDILSKWRVHQSSDTWTKKDLFYSEQLDLIDKLPLLNIKKDDKNFLNIKNEFIKKVNFANIINYIEHNIQKKKIYREIFGKKLKFFHIIILIILATFPYSKFFLRLYRNNFSINP